MRSYFEVYQSANGSWYWRLWAANGKIIADGSEGYFKKGNALRAVKHVFRVVPTAAQRPVKVTENF